MNSGIIILHQHLQVVLTGEGSDEIFGGYLFLLLDYLRQPDPAGLSLGISLPSEAERQDILSRLEAQSRLQSHVSLSAMSFSDAHLARKMLGGIGTHRLLAAWARPALEMYAPRFLERAGPPDAALTIAEGCDARARHHAASGTWHSLNVAMVRFIHKT